MFDFSYGDDSFFDINFIGERTVHTELTCEKSVLILKVRSVTVVKKSTLYIHFGVLSFTTRVVCLLQMKVREMVHSLQVATAQWLMEVVNFPPRKMKTVHVPTMPRKLLNRLIKPLMMLCRLWIAHSCH